ncbi:hypothetical protein Ddc_10408 [Ditylenchus destructor]|nr:hypothetical protein Ddc_10408 [Ditylenchus destructor]
MSLEVNSADLSSMPNLAALFGQWFRISQSLCLTMHYSEDNNNDVEFLKDFICVAGRRLFTTGKQELSITICLPNRVKIYGYYRGIRYKNKSDGYIDAIIETFQSMNDVSTFHTSTTIYFQSIINNTEIWPTMCLSPKKKPLQIYKVQEGHWFKAVYEFINLFDPSAVLEVGFQYYEGNFNKHTNEITLLRGRGNFDHLEVAIDA